MSFFNEEDIDAKVEIMFEILKSVARDSNIINVEGVTGNDYTFFKTSGVTIHRDRINLSCASGWDYIRVPRMSSPQPLRDNCEIVMEYRINAFLTGAEFVPLGHWASGGWALCHNSNGGVKFADTPYAGMSIRRPIYLSIPTGTRSNIKYRYINGTREVYSNGILVDSVYSTPYTTMTDWGIGTYFNGVGGSSTEIVGNNDKANWDLFKLSIKFLP